MKFPEKQVAITGIGQTRAARPSPKSGLSLTIQACREALADAGLAAADVHGVSTYPGMRDDGLGFSPVSIAEVRHSFGMHLDWYSSANQDSAGHMSALFNAINAIAAGMTDHVLLFRTVTEATARLQSPEALTFGGGAKRVWGMWSWPGAFNATSPATWYALYAQRHFQLYGTRPEQLGQIAVNGRRMAAHNPNAIYTKPLTIDDYLASPVISSPLRMLDCDAPIDGSTAIVLSRVDCAKDLRNPPLRFEAIGSSIARGGVTRADDFTSFGAEDAAAMMWSRTTLRPKDLDVAQVYDGFSVLTLHWIEALGLCGKGEAGAYLEGGTRIGLDGELPMNTSGGQLSAGRFHGYGHTHEACVQLWGRGGGRQVKDARAVAVSNGAFGHGCFVLVRD